LIRPGEHYAVIRDDEGAATSFEYAPTPVLRYVVGQKPDGTWQARKEEKPLVVKTADVSGRLIRRFTNRCPRRASQARW